MREEELMFLTREEAIETLKKLKVYGTLGVLSHELMNRISDIITCIEMEEQGYHIWGAPNHHVVLIRRFQKKDTLTPQTISRIDTVARKYRFLPSTIEISSVDNKEESSS